MAAAGHGSLSQEFPSHALESRVRHCLELSLVWAVWVVVTVALFLFVRHYARNIPFMDDWAMVPVITGHEPISLK